MTYCNDRLLILDADGTTIDAFSAIEQTSHRITCASVTSNAFRSVVTCSSISAGCKEFPRNLKRQRGRQKRAQLVSTLTDVYREKAMLYPGMADWLTDLVRHRRLRVGIVTRNITHEPEMALRRLLALQQVDVDGLDFLHHVPLRQGKVDSFRQTRDAFAINPARAYACGNEKADFAAAPSAGIYPFMVSYGFEDFARLTARIGVPPEPISRSPDGLRERVSHALDVVGNLPVAGAIRHAAAGRAPVVGPIPVRPAAGRMHAWS